MPYIKIRGRAAAAITPLVTSLACLALAACGSSSGGSSTGSQTAKATVAAATSTSAPPASTTTEQTSPAAVHRRRLVAVQVAKCMRRNGVDVPEPGPKGFIRINSAVAGNAQFHAAVTKCDRLLVGALGSTSAKK
jgi:hypothetical protein